MSGIMCIMASTSEAVGTTLDTQAVTNGGDGSIIDLDRRRGFISAAIGSISDGTSNLYSGAAITQLVYDEGFGETRLAITGTLANSGWTTLVIGSTSFTRASASFSTSGGITYWAWASGSLTTFGAIGVNVTCTFS